MTKEGNSNQHLYVPVAILVAALIMSLSVLHVGGNISSKLTGAAIATTGSGSGSGSGSTGSGSTATAPTPTSGSTINAADLVDDDPFLGPADAEIVVIEFSDFECPFCGASAGTNQALIDRFQSQDPNWEAAIPKLREYAEQGRIKLVYRDFPLSIHPNAQKAAEAGQCANDQGKFWDMHDKIFENQQSMGISSLKQYAGSIGLNQETFDQCLDSGKHQDEVRDDFNAGVQLGVEGTPTFVINDKVLVGAQPWSAFEQVLSQLGA
ncbi:MAG: DsbA family protein [DPANN group archaeon]|nr:DsbA family protein [DPANN group archaeon]